MNSHTNRSRRRHEATRKDSRLAFEQLESRLMNAMDGIDYHVQLLASPDPIGLSSVVGNAEPTIARPAMLVNGTTVRTRSASVSVLGADDMAEQNLQYTWQVLESPSSSVVRFATNGTNAAKNNSITFDREGTYAVSVTIQDAGGLTTTSTLRFDVIRTLARFVVRNPDGQAFSSQNLSVVSGVSQRLSIQGLDQFGREFSTIATPSWRTISAPSEGSSRLTFQSGVGTVSFTRAGRYTASIQSNGITASLNFDVTQSYTRTVAIDARNVALSTTSPISVAGTSQQLTARALDQFGKPMAIQPTYVWTIVSSPAGSAPLTSISGNRANLTFNQSGTYALRANAQDAAVSVYLNVAQTLTSVRVTADPSSIAAGATRQFRAAGLDQFGKAMVNGPTFVWSATGGTIDSNGLFRAGSVAGNFSVTARMGTVSGVGTATVSAPIPQPRLQDSGIAALVQTYYVDGSISRQEMIDLLRSAGVDGSVTSTELADLRYIVSSPSTYTMPVHVRELARDVVNSNYANLNFQGQAAGNLTTSSSSTLLNNLVDKWFLGADVPVLTSSSLRYQEAVGNLFSNGTPLRTDARQGALGDCYFIASIASIAEKNADAIRSLFIDNGDNTFTVRFFGGALGYNFNNGLVTAGFVSGSGVADYVTVNRRLPVYSNGMLAYSGNGLSASSSSTPLWIALAEKAYAQWNETRNEGRDGTNRYASIEGGWMSNVNAQVLGYNSTNYTTSSTSKQTLVNALNSRNAVTIGTTSSPNAGGLVGGHAYIVTGYDAGTDKFNLYNPWGVSHPSPLTWAQLQSNTSMFIVTSTSGSTGVSSGQLRLSSTDVLVGNWTTVLIEADLLEKSQSDDSPNSLVTDRVSGVELDSFEQPLFIQDTVDPATDRTPIAFGSLEWNGLSASDEELTEGEWLFLTESPNDFGIDFFV